jgi:hypothetical protein
MAQVIISNNGPTAVDPGPAREVSAYPAPSTLTSSLRLTDHSIESRTRFFIGPVPISVAAPQIKQTRRVMETLTRVKSFTSIHSADNASEADDTQATSDLNEYSDERLWRFIRRTQAGSSDDSSWGDGITPHLRGELIMKLKSSAWLSDPKSKQHTRTQWLGDSFEIGKDILGQSNIRFSSIPPTTSPASGSLSSAAIASSPSDVQSSTVGHSTTPLIRVINNSPDPSPSAPAEPPQDTVVSGLASPPQLPPPLISSLEFPAPSQSSRIRFPSDLSPLSPPHGPLGAPQDARSLPATKADGIRSALRGSRIYSLPEDSRVRKRSVNFATVDASDGANEDSPAAPETVLTRSSSHGELAGTSAGAADVTHPLSDYTGPSIVLSGKTI